MVQTASQTQNIRVESITPLDPPSEYWKRFPATPEIEDQVAGHRREIERIVSGEDDRMLMIVGPCSIHDTVAGLEYATRLRALAEDVKDRIFVVGRVYFEKPRTTVGWKGLINDPHLNGSSDVSTGLARAREFLLQVCALGTPHGDRVAGALHAPVPGRPGRLGRHRRDGPRRARRIAWWQAA